MAYQLEEECSFVCLQGGLGVNNTQRAVNVILSEESGCSRELLDELPKCQRTWLILWTKLQDFSRRQCFLFQGRIWTHLLQSLVVNEARRILRNFELAFLNLLTKLPRGESKCKLK